MHPQAQAQDNRPSQKSRHCKMVESCSVIPPIPECLLQADTRNCTRSIGIFNTQIHDPVCEAAKAAQNQTFQVQKLACESQKSAAKAENEWKRQRCLAVANICTLMLPPAEETKFSGTRLLWVDDHPDNNIYERQALTELGATIVTANDTDQAMVHLTNVQTRFDVVISDFERVGDNQAGYTLLARIRKLADPIQVVLYSGSSTRAFVAEATKRGAFGETNEPKELISLVIRAADLHRRTAAKPPK